MIGIGSSLSLMLSLPRNIFMMALYHLSISMHLLKKTCVKGRDNPWFSDALSVLIHECDVAWAKSRQSDLSYDWICFRQL